MFDEHVMEMSGCLAQIIDPYRVVERGSIQLRKTMELSSTI